MYILSEFFILKHRNISKNMHHTKKMPEIKKNFNKFLLQTFFVRCVFGEIFLYLSKCEGRYGPTLAQHRQKFAEDRLPISCHCWNDNSGMHLAANSGPNSGRQHLFSTQQRTNAVPNFGFFTSRMVCRGKSDTLPSNVPSMSPTLALLLSALDPIVKMTIGLV